MKNYNVWLVSVSNTVTEEKINSYSFKSFLNIFQKYLWFNFQYWKNIYLDFNLSCPSDRANDINEFIHKKEIDIIMPIWWWAFSNEILDYIDWNALSISDKIIIWYSDITALLNANYSMTWKISYHWPTPWALAPDTYWSLETFLLFKKLVLDKEKEIDLVSNEFYYDYTADLSIYKWWIIEDWWLKIIKNWSANWTIIWWNLSTFCLLLWTKYMPSLEWKVFFIEECWELSIWVIRRQLMQIKSLPWFNKLSWIVFWRLNSSCFRDYDITWNDTIELFSKWLNIPIISNLQFWHIYPFQTFPIWWKIEIDTYKWLYKLYS